MEQEVGDRDNATVVEAPIRESLLPHLPLGLGSPGNFAGPSSMSRDNRTPKKPQSIVRVSKSG